MAWTINIPKIQLEEFLKTCGEDVDENETHRDLSLRVYRKKIQELPEKFKAAFEVYQHTLLLSQQKSKNSEKKMYEEAEIETLKKLLSLFGIDALETCQLYLHLQKKDYFFSLNWEEIEEKFKEFKIDLREFLVQKYGSFVEKQNRPLFE